MTVDVVDFLTGAEDAEEQPDDPDGPSNDYYIRNVNPRLRTLPVGEDAAVTPGDCHRGAGHPLDPPLDWPGTAAAVTSNVVVGAQILLLTLPQLYAAMRSTRP